MKSVLILMMMIMSFFPLTAQTLAKNDPLKFDADYYLMEKDFTKALNTYKNILRTEPDNADIKYKIGICYLNSESEKDQAIPYLEDAVQKVSEKYNSNSFDEENAPVDALFLLGSAYRVNNQIDKAIEAYKKYQGYVDPKDDYNIRVVEQYIRSCELASKMQQNPIPISVVNLGNPVNNEVANYNAVISGDGKTMFYTSPARQGYDIFLTTFQDTAWSAPRNMTSALGTGKYMITSDLSYDGTTLLLVLDDAINSDIYMCRFVKGKWTKAEPLGKEINSKFNETHASLSSDGRVIYFTSNRKGGIGDLDIYKSEPDPKGAWGKPVNLGPIVNTALNEETPFVSDIGDRLYFSSEGHEGIGGYDVYYYDFSSPGNGVVNLGFPLNSTDNDLFFVPTGDGSTAYYAMKRDDSYGGRDIYLVNIEKPVIPETEIQETVVAHEDLLVLTDTATVIAADTIPSVSTTDTMNLPVLAQIEEPEKLSEDTIPEPVAIYNDPVQEESTPVVEEQVMPLVEENRTDKISEVVISEIVAEQNYNSKPAMAYRIQIMALRKPVDPSRLNAINGVMISRNGDNWYRYTIGNTTSLGEAEKLLAEIKSKGFHDAFIRPLPLNPRYTIQVMAVPGPVVTLDRFANLPSINIIRGEDRFCRYSTGEYATREEAAGQLAGVRDLGYRTAFVTTMKNSNE